MHRTMSVGRRLLALLLVAWLWVPGCDHGKTGVAPVSGTVTLDDAPHKAASVTFLPKDGGRPSFGVTDEQGQYVLEYSLEEAGAEVGACVVKISTASQDDGSGGKASKELVPKRYRTTPIEVQVEPKSNTIDIALTSK
jgi:hypothetical protein